MAEASGPKLKVCIIGSGNWGSAVAKIVGFNAQKHARYNDCVNMYVYEEMVDGKKLTEIINTQHENVKYLPGFKIPENVVAVPDVKVAAKDADILVFVLPHSFVARTCQALKDVIKPNTIGVSLIKGLDHGGSGLVLVSSIIHDILGIECSVLMGANLAGEVAEEKFGEATIGCRHEGHGVILKDLFHTHFFKINVVHDADTVELCGALKNAVAIGAGIVDAMGFGDNTKAAIIRLGLVETINFVKKFYKGAELETFYESCGVADLITTCYGGRNRKAGEYFVRSGKSFEEIEQELLGGQKLQGPHTAYEVYQAIKQRGLQQEFPLFCAIYNVCFENHSPEEMMDTLKNHF